MKRNYIIYCLLILIAWSCAKNEGVEEKVLHKPAGKYLSEIWTNVSPFIPGDSLKVVEFEYDNNRYLKTINYYIPETQQLQRHSDLFYNTDGTLNHIEVNYVGSNAMIDERFTYENMVLVMIEGYKIEDSKTTMIGKTEFKVDAVNNAVDIYPYDLKDGLLVKRTYPQKYTFSSSGNLIKYHYNIGEGGFSETMEDYEYDNRFSPFANLDIPYYNIVSAYFSLGESFSVNNVVRRYNYLHENGISYKKPTFETFIYQYEGDFPVEASEYSNSPNFPIELKSQFFFKYVDL